MSTISATTARATASTRVSWVRGLITVAAAAVATTLLAVVLQAAGVGLEIDGESIAVLAFAQMVILGY